MKTEVEIIQDRMDALYEWAAQAVVNNTLVKSDDFNGIEAPKSNNTTTTNDKRLAVLQLRVL